MTRPLLNVLTLLSLLLCVATVALWVRSFWVQDTGQWLAGGKGTTMTVVALDSHVGAARLQAISLTFPADTPGTTDDWFAGDGWSPGWHSWPEWDADTTPWQDNLWPSYEHVAGTVGGHGAIPLENWTALVPYWLPAVVTVLLPMWSLARLVRTRRRRRRGCCTACGYDLRSTPDRCPECGAENRAIISN